MGDSSRAFASAVAHVEAARLAFMRGEAPPGEPVCASCGCWQLEPCEPPCSWADARDVDEDLAERDLFGLCSTCGPPTLLERVSYRDFDCGDCSAKAGEECRKHGGGTRAPHRMRRGFAKHANAQNFGGRF